MVSGRGMLCGGFNHAPGCVREPLLTHVKPLWPPVVAKQALQQACIRKRDSMACTLQQDIWHLAAHGCQEARHECQRGHGLRVVKVFFFSGP